MKEFSNNLTPAELERLALLAEECSEVVQIVNKIIRHGYESFNPYDEDKTTNRALLSKELGHLSLAGDLITDHRDVDVNVLDRSYEAKKASIKRWLHHNQV